MISTVGRLLMAYVFLVLFILSVHPTAAEEVKDDIFFLLMDGFFLFSSLQFG